jgi:hypothetical protein
MNLSTYSVSGLTLIVLSVLSAAIANAQAPGDDLKQSITGGFIYGIPAGAYDQNNAPGYSVGYTYRPLHWLVLEAGLDQVIDPLGSVEFLNNGQPFFYNDQLFFVPFGPRFLWAPAASRWRVSVGGGGAYAYHHYAQYFASNSSQFGAQAVFSGDYALSPSGRFRIGVTARYYYTKDSTADNITRVFTFGPSFIFSFH